MFIVAVQWKDGGALTLMFSGADKARARYEDIKAKWSTASGAIEAWDDYGTQTMLALSEIRGVVMQDVSRVHVGNGEAQMIAALAQVELQKRAAAEPKLRTLATAGQPMGMPPGFRA